MPSSMSKTVRGRSGCTMSSVAPQSLSLGPHLSRIMAIDWPQRKIPHASDALLTAKRKEHSASLFSQEKPNAPYCPILPW